MTALDTQNWAFQVRNLNLFLVFSSWALWWDLIETSFHEKQVHPVAHDKVLCLAFFELLIDCEVVFLLFLVGGEQLIEELTILSWLQVIE
jgi:hypothetical protein